jgi:hypothetical protein
VMALCGVHARHLARHAPQIADKIRQTSNGVRVDLFERLEQEGLPRKPRRLIWASSPDRGLAQAVLPLWPRILERVPDAELHIYYGFDNIDKMVAGNPQAFGWLGKLRDQAKALMDQPGVTWHGRVGQEELYRAWLQSAVWPQFSAMPETSCVACMEAQAGGAIPVTVPYWAIGENVKHGTFVNGHAYSDPLTRARLVDETVALLLDGNLQAAIRAEMIPEARARCDWERVVDQWEAWIGGWPESAVAQFAFQHKHLEGPTVNIGAGCDLTNLRGRGAVNVDCREVDPGTGWPNKPDLIADATAIPLPDKSFRTAILGDILEHCKDTGTAKAMVNEAKRLADRVVITCPEDRRSREQQFADGGNVGAVPTDNYSAETDLYHTFPVTREWLLEVAGEPTVYQPIRYGQMNGHGVVIECC